MIKKELKQLWSNKMLLITAIVICFVPAMYAGVFLKGVWDPYNNLKNVPVAVVNNDQPVEQSGQKINLGEKLTDELKKNPEFKWDFVNEAAAKQGMDDNKYYIAITIPKDFSKNSLTITDANPQKLNLKYETNGSMNLPVETVATGAMEKIKGELQSQVTLTYANIVIQQIKQTGSKLSEAADGAEQLNNGANQLGNGLNSLRNGADRLTTGINQLSSGADKLSNGVNQLASGASQLDSGVNQLVSQTKQSATQLEASLPDAKKLTDGATSLSTGLTTLSSGSKMLAAALDNKAKLTNDPIDIKLAAQAKSLADNLQGASDGAKAVAGGTNTIYTKLNGMSQQLTSPDTTTKLNQLTSGSKQLAQGLASLQGNVPTLTLGIRQLSSGSKQLASGTGQLTNGNSKLTAGASQLATQLKAGADTINNSSLSEKTAEQIAEPVITSQTQKSVIPNYGHGLAPFFISVSLYVGCMLFCFVYPVRRVAHKSAKWYEWFASRVAIGAISATSMAIILGLIMQAVGLKIQNVGEFYLTIILFANAMMFVCMTLALAFDNPGRFIAMLILVFSLGASGGTFPIETSSNFYQSIHPLVPITYPLAGLRSAIAGGISTSTVNCAHTVLAVTLIVALSALAIATYTLKKLRGGRAHNSRLDGKDDLLAEKIAS